MTGGHIYVPASYITITQITSTEFDAEVIL
jgi:hypothetical protein